MVRLRRWLRRLDRTSSNTTVKTSPNSFNVRFFSYDTLRIATNNFSTIIGEGAYGRVFKGVLPGDGRSVAIKALLKPDRDGFLEMVEFMFHLHHINLIRVIGCCVENDEQLLVCEFAENGSVGQLLHKIRNGCEKPNSTFNWERRAAVCIGTARGLSYLHEEICPRIIHCDVKPANILLDANFNPKIADFDLIHFVDRPEKSSDVGGIKGTMAYLDPEYVVKGRLTQKVDVYSFGLVMLEIITGRKAVDFETNDRWILDWVMMMRKDHNILDIVDRKLVDFPEEDVERFINVALLCTQSNSEQRPSMFRVVHMLYGGHKSDQEISEMATEAIAAQRAQWIGDDSIQTSVSMSSLAISTSGEEGSSHGSTSTKDDSTRSKGKGKCSVEGEMRSASSSKEEVVVREYFERSMEKIMRIQVERHRRTRAVNKFCEQVSMEVIYPPFLSAEYPPPPSRSEC